MIDVNHQAQGEAARPTRNGPLRRLTGSDAVTLWGN